MYYLNKPLGCGRQAGFPLGCQWRELGSISMETRQPQPGGEGEEEP